MATSKIEWTQMSWNPTTGCSKISIGCQNCYAEKMALRLKAMGLKKYKNGFNLTLHPESLNIPYTWKKNKIIFVNSMSDLFHEEIPLDYIKKVFQVMNNCRQHIFQVLTKRADILLKYSKKLFWTPNIWMGVTVENQDVVMRIAKLKKTNAKIKFLSLEPLLGSIGRIDLNGINWIIVGGESGCKARYMNPEWVKEIKRQCKFYNIPFFFKQWGGVKKKKAGRLLDGKIYNETPEIEFVFG